MARIPQSDKKTRSVSKILSDSGSSLGSLLQRASDLMQLEQLLSGCLDPGLAAHFQVASIRGNRVKLITPAATWATRLKMQAPHLLDAMHRAGYTEINHVDIRVAPLVEQPTTSRKRKQLTPAAKQALELMGRLTADGED